MLIILHLLLLVEEKVEMMYYVVNLVHLRLVVVFVVQVMAYVAVIIALSEATLVVMQGPVILRHQLRLVSLALTRTMI